MSKVLKGLTNRLIKASKGESLKFSKEDLNNIKNSAKVTYDKREDGWYLSVYTKYNESCCGGYYWTGDFRWYDSKNEGTMNIYSGFTGNPIGRIDDRYTCRRPCGTDYKAEFELILDYMIKARGGSLADNQAYCDFVRRTGCLD